MIYLKTTVESYKRPILIRLFNLLYSTKILNYSELNRWYTKKFNSKIPKKVSSYIELMLEQISKENQLDFFGAFLFNKMLKEQLINIYNIEKSTKERDLKTVFIISLPRTGSTLFHHVLSQSFHVRTLSFWEQNNIGNYKFKILKVIQGKAMLFGQNFILPHLKYIHKVVNRGPEECSKVLLSTFITQIYPIMFDLPAYKEKLLEEDFDYTYHFFKKSLMNMPNKHNQPWLLKAPMHLQALDQIQKHFPKAKIIFLHRDLDKVLPSALTLGIGYAQLFQPQISQDSISNNLQEVLSHDINKAIKHIQSSNMNILHINYDEFISETENVIQKVSKHTGFNIVKKIKIPKQEYKFEYTDLINIKSDKFEQYKKYYQAIFK